ncbi:MAG TPA: zinc ABC transporter substrate-binding protein [Candidatus Sulfotelmatobacter sp.]|nr:zinc ABC transporter substrate-binding protein [Candidatus Sulfotelmatobacter sp.]
MKKTLIAITIVVLLGALGLFLKRTHQPTPSSTTIQIVAAENFYGDIAKQLGGDKVQIMSILSDPNADPHEYESSVKDAKAVSTAQIVIKNGDGYDTWMDKLLSASPNANRVVLTGTMIANHTLPDNPHVWYGIDNVQTIATKITDALKKADPTDSATFANNLHTFITSLQPLTKKMNVIKATYQGTPIGLTETIYLYQTKPMNLNVLTSFPFEKAIAEGNDPSADDVAKANDQITKKQIKVLIYNAQTVTPITTNLQNAAKQQHIPVVSVTETLPKNTHYQEWMMNQFNKLQQALAATVSH